MQSRRGSIFRHSQFGFDRPYLFISISTIAWAVAEWRSGTGRRGSARIRSRSVDSPTGIERDLNNSSGAPDCHALGANIGSATKSASFKTNSYRMTTCDPGHFSWVTSS